MDPAAYISSALKEHNKIAPGLPEGVLAKDVAAQFLEILAKESDLDYKNMFVFYHGALPCHGFIFDICTLAYGLKNPDLSEVYFFRSSYPNISEESIEDFYFRKIFPCFLTEQKKYFAAESIEKWKKAYAKLYERDPSFIFVEESEAALKSNKSYVRPRRPLLQGIYLMEGVRFGDIFLCANVFLFGNYHVRPCYTMSYYFNQKSLQTNIRRRKSEALELEHLLHKTLLALGISPEKVKNYRQIYDKYFCHQNFDEGCLYQIFMDKEYVDKLCYVSEENGMRLYLKNDGRALAASEILQMVKSDPEGLEKFLRDADGFEHRIFHEAYECHKPGYPYYKESPMPLMNLLQARIWLHGELFIKGQKEGKIKIFRYFLKKTPQQEYISALKEQLKKDLIPNF
ncbi:MAG: hypothetical protein Tsb0015_13710 [Simkaniaceae bacterium]